MNIPKESTNAFHYISLEENMIEHIFKEQGYEKKTTFFGSLSIGEGYGLENLKQVVTCICKKWFNNVEYFTEFIMCVNHKAREHYERKNIELSKYYNSLYHKLVDDIYNSWNRESLDYFYKITD